MKKILFVILAATVMFSPAFALAKKKIAVMDLVDKAGNSHGGWHNVGSGMADMLVTALVKTGKFDVIEREQLHKVMEEQKLGSTGAITPESAAKVGQILGINFIVTGSVTEFGIKDSQLGVGNLGSILPFGGGVSTHTNTAKVAMDVRFIDTSTAQILNAFTGEGEESSTGVSVDLNAAPSVAFGKTGFDETVIGKATRKSIEALTKQMLEAAYGPQLVKIIKIDGNKIYINAGEDDGATNGKNYDIWQKGEELLDPDSGVSLGSEDKKVGRAWIVKVEKKYSIAEVDNQNVTKANFLKEQK